jgi:hypothetical protein
MKRGDTKRINLKVMEGPNERDLFNGVSIAESSILHGKKEL